jgi:hypothetical protein
VHESGCGHFSDVWEMSDLSPQSGPKRTLRGSLSPIATYEYTPLAPGRFFQPINDAVRDHADDEEAEPHRGIDKRPDQRESGRPQEMCAVTQRRR